MINKFSKISLALLLVFFSVVISGCTSGSSKSSQKSLTIAVYSGDWEKNIKQAALDDFTKKTGIKLTITSGADAEWLTKLKAGNGKSSPYDLLILQPDSIQRAASSHLLQPLTTKNVKNLKDLYPSVQSKLKVNGKQYGASFSIGQLGLAYRKDLVKNPPKSWKDLWKSEYKGHVAMSPLTYSAGLQAFSGIINAFGGKESDNQEVNNTFNKLKSLKENISSYPDNPGAIQTLLQRGDAWIVPFWDGRIFALQDSGLKLGFTYPKEGAVAAVASWAIPSASTNKQNAYKLLNYLLSPSVEKKFADKSFYGMSNKNTKYNDEIRQKIQIGDEKLNQLKWVDYNVVYKKLTNWTNKWNTILGGN